MLTSFLLGFASQLQESVSYPLKPDPHPDQETKKIYRGNVPEWIDGTLYRNGPGTFDLECYRLRHWFDGLAMLHRFDFKGGNVWYSNKMLATDACRKAMKTGELAYREFASFPHETLLDNLHFLLSPKYSDNTAINVTKVDNRFVAMSDSPVLVEFQPDTLDVLDHLEYSDKLGQGFITTPHPHYDAKNRTLINYFGQFTSMARSANYRIYHVDDGSRSRQLIASINTKAPAYMHSFAVTENYVILMEFSLILKKPIGVVFSKKPVLDDYYWAVENGTRFLVADKRDHSVKTWQGEASFGFHHINAFEQNGDIFIDVVGYNKPDLLRSLLIDELLKPEDAPQTPMGQFRRYHLPQNATYADYQVMMDDEIEMPTINYAYDSRPYRYAYGQSRNPLFRNDFYNQLIKLDLQSGQCKTWFEEGHYPGEPVFIPKPNSQQEDEGVVVSIVLDTHRVYSFLLVLNAQTFEEITRLQMPYVMPFGFHGTFFARQ